MSTADPQLMQLQPVSHHPVNLNPCAAVFNGQAAGGTCFNPVRVCGNQFGLAVCYNRSPYVGHGRGCSCGQSSDNGDTDRIPNG